VKHMLGSISVATAACLACGEPAEQDVGADSARLPVPATAADAGTYTLDDFRRLRWLDGRWRGLLPNGGSFFEQYRVIDDSTIAMHTFDSTFVSKRDSARITLRGGTIADEGGSARWVATRLDSTGVDFAPHHGAANYFTWSRETDDRWTATLRSTDKDGRPQSVVYTLQRIGR
jgi:hypothetical protein